MVELATAQIRTFRGQVEYPLDKIYTWEACFHILLLLFRLLRISTELFHPTYIQRHSSTSAFSLTPLSFTLLIMSVTHLFVFPLPRVLCMTCTDVARYDKLPRQILKLLADSSAISVS